MLSTPAAFAAIAGNTPNTLDTTYPFYFPFTTPVPNNDGAPFNGRMLVIPSGQVLYSAGSPEIYAYTPELAPAEEWRPRILPCPKIVVAGGSFLLEGRQFNGLSQASMYGDDATVATNYPIVRLTSSRGRVVFCRTFNHSTMAVATRNAIVNTRVEDWISGWGNPGRLSSTPNPGSRSCSAPSSWSRAPPRWAS